MLPSLTKKWNPYLFPHFCDTLQGWEQRKNDCPMNSFRRFNAMVNCVTYWVECPSKCQR